MKKLLISYIFSSTSTWSVAFLMPLIMLNITNSALMVSITYAVSILPFIVITPFAGVISDSYDRKKLIMMLELLSIIIVLAISQVSFNKSISSMILFLVLTFLASSIGASHHPIFQSMINSVISQDKIKEFISYSSVCDNLVSFIAPAIIGFMMMFLSINSIMIIIIVGYLASLVFLFFVKYIDDYISAISKAKAIDSLKEGFIYVYNNKIIFHICILFFAVNFGIRIIYTNLIYHFDNDFSASNTFIGYFFAFIGVGSVVGSLVAPKIIGKAQDITIILLATIFTGVFSLMMCIAFSSISSVIIWTISSAIQSIIIVTFFTLRQKIVPNEIIGRVVGVTRLVAYLSIPLSAITGGLIMKYINNFYLISLIGGAIIFFTGVLYYKPLTKLITAKNK